MQRHRRLEIDLWVGKILGVGNDNPLQYFCLGNSMDRGAWRATVHEVTRSQCVLGSRENRAGDRHTDGRPHEERQGEGHVITEAEIGGVQSGSQEPQGLPARRGKEGSPLGCSERGC